MARGDADDDVLAGAVGADGEGLPKVIGYSLGVVAGFGFGDAVGGLGSFSVEDSGLVGPCFGGVEDEGEEIELG